MLLIKAPKLSTIISPSFVLQIRKIVVLAALLAILPNNALADLEVRFFSTILKVAIAFISPSFCPLNQSQAEQYTISRLLPKITKVLIAILIAIRVAWQGFEL